MEEEMLQAWVQLTTTIKEDRFMNRFNYYEMIVLNALYNNRDLSFIDLTYSLNKSSQVSGFPCIWVALALLTIFCSSAFLKTDGFIKFNYIIFALLSEILIKHFNYENELFN